MPSGRFVSCASCCVVCVVALGGVWCLCAVVKSTCPVAICADFRISLLMNLFFVPNFEWNFSLLKLVASFAPKLLEVGKNKLLVTSALWSMAIGFPNIVVAQTYIKCLLSSDNCIGIESQILNKYNFCTYISEAF